MTSKIEFKEYKKSTDSSSVWQHFLRSTDGLQAQCKQCKKILKIAGSTSPLHKHLKLHPTISIASTQQTASTSTAASTRETETISEPPTKKVKMTDFFKSEESAEVLVSKLAALDGLSFNCICRSTSIRTLFNKSGLKLPHSPHTIRKIVVTRSEELKQEVKKELEVLKSRDFRFTASLDEWTSLRNIRYMNVNIHCQELKDKNFRNLGLARITGSANADNCYQILENRLAEYDLSLEDDVCGLASDGASVMKAMVRQSTSFHQLCLAHGIQCAVLDVLYKNNQRLVERIPETSDVESYHEDSSDEEDDNEGFIVVPTPANVSPENAPEITKNYKDVIAKVRRVVKFFKSPLRSERLYKYDQEGEKANIKLSLDVKTRWNSLAVMIQNFLKLKNSVQKALIDYNNEIRFTDEEIQLLENLSSSLCIIKATVEAICEQKADLLTAEAALQFMIEKLDQENSCVSDELMVSLKKRISERRIPILSGTLKYLHNCANFYKEGPSSYPFQNPDSEEILKFIAKMNTQYFSPKPQPEPMEPTLDDSTAQSQSHTEEGTANLNTTFSIKEQLQKRINEAISATPSTSSAHSDSSSQLDMETKVRVEMALYDSGGERGLHLSRVYKLLKTVPPTSVEAERVFSAAGYMCNKIRSLMHDNTLDALSFLRSYYQKSQVNK